MHLPNGHWGCCGWAATFLDCWATSHLTSCLNAVSLYLWASCWEALWPWAFTILQCHEHFPTSSRASALPLDGTKWKQNFPTEIKVLLYEFLFEVPRSRRTPFNSVVKMLLRVFLLQGGVNVPLDYHLRIVYLWFLMTELINWTVAIQGHRLQGIITCPPRDHLTLSLFFVIFFPSMKRFPRGLCAADLLPLPFFAALSFICECGLSLFATCTQHYVQCLEFIKHTQFSASCYLANICLSVSQDCIEHHAICGQPEIYYNGKGLNTG